MSNAQLAVELYRSLMKSECGKQEFDVQSSSSSSDSELTQAELKGLSNARWPGRCQIVRNKDKSKVWYLDGAHTTESLDSCAAWFVEASLKDMTANKQIKRTLIFNTTHDRKSEELLSGMMKAIANELQQHQIDSSEADTFVDTAVFCTNTTYKDGASSGGEYY